VEKWRAELQTVTHDVLYPVALHYLNLLRQTAGAEGGKVLTLFDPLALFEHGVPAQQQLFRKMKDDVFWGPRYQEYMRTTASLAIELSAMAEFVRKNRSVEPCHAVKLSDAWSPEPAVEAEEILIDHLVTLKKLRGHMVALSARNNATNAYVSIMRLSDVYLALTEFAENLYYVKEAWNSIQAIWVALNAEDTKPWFTEGQFTTAMNYLDASDISALESLLVAGALSVEDALALFSPKPSSASAIDIPVLGNNVAITVWRFTQGVQAQELATLLKNESYKHAYITLQAYLRALQPILERDVMLATERKVIEDLQFTGRNNDLRDATQRDAVWGYFLEQTDPPTTVDGPLKFYPFEVLTGLSQTRYRELLELASTPLSTRGFFVRAQLEQAFKLITEDVRAWVAQRIEAQLATFESKMLWFDGAAFPWTVRALPHLNARPTAAQLSNAYTLIWAEQDVIRDAFAKRVFEIKPQNLLNYAYYAQE